jgi:hypothetical protein
MVTMEFVSHGIPVTVQYTILQDLPTAQYNFADGGR